MGRLLVGMVLLLGVVLPAQAQKTHSRYLTRTRAHAWLKRPPDERPPQDLRSDAERQRDHQVWLHYSREAQLDAIGTLALQQDEGSMLARAEAVRRLERDRVRRALRWLAHHPTATLATIPEGFSRRAGIYNEARNTVALADLGDAGDALGDLERQVLRELRQRQEESNDDSP